MKVSAFSRTRWWPYDRPDGGRRQVALPRVEDCNVMVPINDEMLLANTTPLSKVVTTYDTYTGSYLILSID